MRANRHLACAGMALLLLTTGLAGCGGAEAASESVEAYLEAQLAILDEMADAFAGVEAPDDANAVAARIEGDFIPRIQANARGINERRAATSDGDPAAFDEEMREALDDGMRDRLGRAAERLDARITRVMNEPRLATAALEESLFALLEAVSELNDAVPSGAAGAPQDVAAWCREMSARPQAQWSMDDAFAFANRCVGR
jgi:hypothetical protein